MEGLWRLAHNEPELLVYAGLAVFGAALVAVLLKDRSEENRGFDLAELAARAGMDFQPLPERAHAVVKDVGAFQFAPPTALEVWRNLLIRRTQDGTLALFDAIESQPGPKDIYGRDRSRPLFCTVAARFDDRSRLPRFDLDPRQAAEGLLPSPSSSGLSFESAPEFARIYHLRTADERPVRGLFGSKAVTFFRSHPGWHVKGGGRTLLCYRKTRGPSSLDQRIASERLLEYFEEAQALFSSLSSA